MADFKSKYAGEEIERLLDKAGNIDSIIEEQVTSMIDSKADKSKDLTFTLSAASWSENSITVSAEGITATNNFTVSPSDRDSTTAWSECEVLCTGQGDGTLTFTCSETPTSDINVSVVIIG